MDLKSKDITSLDEDTLRQVRDLAKENFFFFAKGILGFKDLTPRIHKPLCDKLQNLEGGQCAKFVLPRGWFKTTVCTIAYPVWRAIRDPNFTCLLAQNTFTNAESKLRAIRSIFEENQLFRALFPELLPTKNNIWTKSSLCITRSGSGKVESTFECAGIQTAVVSRHYDLILEDDTVAPGLNELGEETLSPSVDSVNQAIGWHRAAMPLLQDQKTGNIVVVGTRWFEKDLLSYIAEKETHYVTYERSCREDANGHSSATGEVTFPEKFSADILERLEKALGPYLFACLYLNNPMSSSDMTFKPEWFSYYEEEPSRKSLRVYTCVDLAGDPAEMKGKDTDYNVVMTVGKDQRTGFIYVLDYWRGRANPGIVCDQIFAQEERWNPVKVGIESVAYQNTFSYWLKEKMRKEDHFFTIEPIPNHKGSKGDRIYGLVPLFSSHTIRFRTWMTHLKDELLAYPFGTHDDLADCLAMHRKFWSLTNAADKAVQHSPEEDVMSFDSAAASIRERNARTVSLLDDVGKTPVQDIFSGLYFN